MLSVITDYRHLPLIFSNIIEFNFTYIVISFLAEIYIFHEMKKWLGDSIHKCKKITNSTNGNYVFYCAERVESETRKDWKGKESSSERKIGYDGSGTLVAAADGQ